MSTGLEVTYAVAGLTAALLFGVWLGIMLAAALRSWSR